MYELELDDEGWVETDAVLAALQRRSKWRKLSEDDLARALEVSNKRRHEMSNGRIRALYGHSIAGKLKNTPAEPPSLLFHGTDPKVVPTIEQSGLQPMKRQYVHLSVDEATASEVGRRKSQLPVVLHILAQTAHQSGIRFYEGNEKVWLADDIPTEYIVFDH